LAVCLGSRQGKQGGGHSSRFHARRCFWSTMCY
jgi:hypothetical protein